MKLVELGFTNTIGIFGINFNMQRITKLIDKGVTKIAICLDNDKETKAGQMASESVAKRVKYLFYTKVVNLPEGKDPDECSVDQLNQAFIESKDI
jgi:DNA primase